MQAKLALERGSVWLSKKTATGWNLDKGKGDGSYSHEITFATPFPSPPKVFAAFSALGILLQLIDIMNDDDLRISCMVISTTTTGFKFEVSTWGATHVWSCAVGWVAYDKDAAQVQGARIESGRIPLKKTNPGWKLDKGSGKRVHAHKLNYEKSFTAATSQPLIMVGFCVLDVLVDDDDHHLKLNTKNISHIGFEIEVETWKKTKVWGVSVAYIAFEGCLPSSTGARIETGVQPIIKTTPNAKKLSQGDGERKVSTEVTFDSEFDEAPQVLTILSMQDVLKGADFRIKTLPKDVTEEKFEVEVATWSDSKVFGCHVSWLAFTNGDTKYGSSSSAASASSSSAASSSTTTTTTTTTSSSPPSTPPKKDDSDEDEEEKPKPETKEESDEEKEKKKGKGKAKTEKKSPKGKEKDSKDKKDSEKDKEKDALSGAKRKDTDDAEDDNVCKVCMDAKVNTCLVPCGHLCLCQTCADLVKKHKEPCPICRGLIKQVVVTFSA